VLGVTREELNGTKVMPCPPITLLEFPLVSQQLTPLGCKHAGMCSSCWVHLMLAFGKQAKKE